MSDWIEWNGGKCPVDPNSLVQVRFQREPHEDEALESSRPMRAKYFWWQHKHYEGSPSGGNIVAYRIIPDPQRNPPRA